MDNKEKDLELTEKKEFINDPDIPTEQEPNNIPTDKKEFINDPDIPVNTEEELNDMQAINEKLNALTDKIANMEEEQVDELVETSKQLEETKEKLEEETKRKKNYRLLSIVELIIIIILLLRGCNGDPSMKGVWWVKDNTPPLTSEEFTEPEIEDQEYIEWEQKFAEEAETNRINIPVITDFTVSKASPYKTLYNPAANADKYYLQYTFTIVGEEEPFYESKLVEGGYKFSVDFGSLLEIGEYTVNVRTSTFEYETFAPKSGDAHEITIKVTE